MDQSCYVLDITVGHKIKVVLFESAQWHVLHVLCVLFNFCYFVSTDFFEIICFAPHPIEDMCIKIGPHHAFSFKIQSSNIHDKDILTLIFAKSLKDQMLGIHRCRRC